MDKARWPAWIVMALIVAVWAAIMLIILYR